MPDFAAWCARHVASELISLEDVRLKLAAKVRLRLYAKDVTDGLVLQIRGLCQHHRGKSQICVSVHTDRGRVYASADKQLSVNPDVDFCRKMKQLVGEENFLLSK